MPKKPKTKVFKIIVVGNSGVGKTCLTHRFCTNSFPDDVIATIKTDFKAKNLRIDNEEIQLQIWDTAGQERFNSLMNQYYRNSDGIVFVYDVTLYKSFKPGLDKWITETENFGFFSSDMPMMILGNKSDMTSSKSVPTHDAKRYAQKKGMLFFEISAKDDHQSDNVETAFMNLAKKMKEKSSELESEESDQPNINIKITNNSTTQDSPKCCSC